MNNKIRLSLSYLLLVVFLSCIVYTPQVYAVSELTDITGHWAQKDIETLVELEIINGYSDNTFRADNPISRAEFMTVTNKSFNFTGTAAIDFSDVPPDKWYAGQIASAYAAGYISGYEDGTMRPEQKISRQEAANIICRILGLKCSDSSPVLAGFIDRGSIPSWSSEPIAAVVEAGYMSGYPDLSFRPTAAISRAEVAVVMNKIRGLKPVLDIGVPEVVKQTYTYNDPSTYGPATGMNTIDGNVIINASRIAFRNTIIEGDLTVSENVGLGEVSFDNVVVKGETYIKGGGPNSIHIIDCEFGSVIVDDEKNIVSIKIEGDTSIGTITMNSGGTLQEIEIKGDGFGEVIVNIPENAVVKLDGTFETLNLNSEGAIVELSSDTVVNTLNVNASAVVSGEGQIEDANINTDNVTLEVIPEVANIAEGVTTQIGDETITGEAGGTVFESDAPAPTPSFGGGGGGGGAATDTTAPILSDVSIGPITIGQNVSATSNEDGTIYLVPEGTAGIEADITAAASGSNGSSTEAAANTAQTLSTAGFAAGEYIVYALDEADNISEPSEPITLEAVMVSSITITVQGGDPVIDSDGGTLQMLAEILPVDASNKAVQWSVEDGTGHAGIDQNGLLTASGQDTDNGTVTVRAQAADGSGTEDTIVITISNQVDSVESISVSGTGGQCHAAVNGTLQMLAEVLPEDLEDKSVNWSVDDTNLASISETGLLTAAASGVVTVTAAAVDGSGISGSADVVIYGGDGTEGNPYTLYTASCINAMRGDTTGCENWGGDDYYILMNDIDISEYSNWEPLEFAGDSFTGGLDGNNHIISGLTIDRPLEDEQGLFSRIYGAIIQNLGLTDVNIIGQDRVGALAGICGYSDISGCYVSGEVEGRDYVGGLIGTLYYYADIYDCYSTADVSGDTTVGGLIAAANASCQTIFCHSSGNVEGNNYTGGLMGKNGENSTLIYSYSDCTVLGSENTGGLVGAASNNASISCCRSSGGVTGSASSTGGLIGLIEGNTLSNCFSSSDVCGTVNVGGLVGSCEDNSSDIFKCYAGGDVTGTQNTGGFIGNNMIFTLVKGCAAVNQQLIRSQGSEASFHRIAGICDDAYLHTNYASSSMMLPDGITMQISKNGLDGLDKAREELKQQETYIDLGWDFDNVWDIDEGNAYPTLQGIAIPSGDPPIMLWSGGEFIERPDSEGSIITTIYATLVNETYADGPFVENTHYTVSNVPAGLTVDISRRNAVNAAITLTGTADSHTAADAIDNLEITFTDAAFSGADASVVTNSFKNDLRIAFDDLMTMTWSGGEFSESQADDGSIETVITVTLENDTFMDGPFVEDTHYTVSNVPSGLTVNISRSSHTEAAITLTGTAENHAVADSISNLGISFTDDAFTGGDAWAVGDSSRTNLMVSYIDDEKGLTLMVYSDADNNLEPHLLQDIQEMKEGVTDDINLIVIVDRHPDYSSETSTLGEDFTDTRLYQITPGTATRIDGSTQFPEITVESSYEANMGDPETLQKFINFCKANYPADKYALIIANHGGGTRSAEPEHDETSERAVCWDETQDDDCMFMAEISDVLDSSQSVDLLAFDACYMGAAEIAYQYRPGNGSFQADVMVASATGVWTFGLNYDGILMRLDASLAGQSSEEDDSTLGGNELYYDPTAMTIQELGAIIVEEFRDDVEEEQIINQSMACFDLTLVEDVKDAVDVLAADLYSSSKKDELEAVRGSGTDTCTMEYFDQSNEDAWLFLPQFDLYDLCERVNGDTANFAETSRACADDVMTAVDDMVLYSYGGSSYTGFIEGQNGLSIFFPDGDEACAEYFYWAYQWWYNSIDTSAAFGEGFEYGNLKWCQDNQDSGTDMVGNWFEMLDAWFDIINDADGGVNGYQY